MSALCYRAHKKSGCNFDAWAHNIIVSIVFSIISINNPNISLVKSQDFPRSKVFALPGGRLAPKPCGDEGVFLARSVEAGASVTYTTGRDLKFGFSGRREIMVGYV